MSKLNQHDREEILQKQFAFPAKEREPIHDAAHVRNAITRFNQVKGVTDAERDEAWKRIRNAAKKFDVEVETIGVRSGPTAKNPATPGKSPASKED